MLVSPPARCLVLRLLMLTLLLPGSARAQENLAILKTAFVYNFAKYVAWPSDEIKSGINLCVFGSDQFADALSLLQGRTAHNVPITVMHPKVEGFGACHIVVVSPDRIKMIGMIKEKIPKSVLTIGDGEGFAEAGGIIALSTAEDRPQFIVNLASAQKAGLAVSSHLLRLAKKVIQ